ncbi:MAG TPA: prolyl oligopeptidase family serine peptidase [Gaiellaceae bacterium]|nr:prolyl oligopeptidase family serine peptidase [Gaiellaceae bacterium]
MKRVSVLAAVATAAGVCAAASAAAASLQGAVGVYRFADGSAAALVEQDGALRLVDYRTGALRQLAQRSRTLFVGGPGVSVPSPVAVRVALVGGPGGTVAAVRLDGALAKRIAVTSTPASFGDGGVRIAGRLLEPPGKGPFPAVVLVPGSVPATRDTYDLWAMFFVSRGFAVLSYDKRGVGASTGTYVRAATDQNLRDLAADVVAGVEWLKHRHDVDARRIGLSGGSQAGWVMELAASRSRDVRWAAFQSGPAMSVGRQLAYSGVTHEGAVDPTDAQIHAALDNAPDSGFDPRPVLAALKIPLLWQLGSVDKRMYTPETLANLAAIQAAGTHDFTIHVYAGGAHSLRLTAHGTIAEERTSPGFVPGVFADLAAWLRRR